MPRKNFCPKCGAELVSGRTFKMICPRLDCDFKDRRHGSGVVDPLIDRREGFNRWISATMIPDPWAVVRHWTVTPDIDDLFAE